MTRMGVDAGLRMVQPRPSLCSPQCQFHNDEEQEVNLDISDELLEAKNEQCGGKLHRDFQAR